MGAFNNLAEATLSRVYSLWSEEGRGWAEEVHPHLYELRDPPALTPTPMPGQSSTITHPPGLTSPRRGLPWSSQASEPARAGFKTALICCVPQVT